MQINRLFEIVYILMNKKRVTANELAVQFEVSKRTILRDIDVLSAANIPIYTVPGKGGGIFIHDSFVLNKTLVSEEEQKQILFSLQSMPATELINTDQVLNRLQSFFTGMNKEWVEVDFSRWGHNEADNARFDMLKNAIIGEQMVSFDYLSPYGESKGLKVCPLRLSFKSKAWYLQSYCVTEQDYRVFKFSRINHIKVLEQSFFSHDYAIPLMKAHDDVATTDMIAVRCFIAQNAKYRIYDEFAKSDIATNDDGSFTLQMSNGRWIYDYILSYGNAIEVLEPQFIRDELAVYLGKIQARYINSLNK